MLPIVLAWRNITYRFYGGPSVGEVTRVHVDAEQEVAAAGRIFLRYYSTLNVTGTVNPSVGSDCARSTKW